MGDDRYLVGLVVVHATCPRHQDYQKLIGDFLPSVIALVDSVIGYLLWVKVGMYLMELIKVHAS